MGKSSHTQASRQASGARFGTRFWDAVEYEIETLDADDFALFLAADRLPCTAAPAFAEALAGSLATRFRARFSN